MPRGKTNKSTTTGRRSTRATTRHDTTNVTTAPLGQVVPVTAPTAPTPIPAQTDFTAFLHLIRNVNFYATII